jgi:hypothetical protein
MRALELCADCGVDTSPCSGKRGRRHNDKWECYLVKDSVWQCAGMGRGFLCIGCLEARLGRQLRPRDFTDAPINDPDDPWKTPRLLSRLIGAHELQARLKRGRAVVKQRTSSRLIGHRLRVARIVLGLSESEAAASVGVGMRTWRTYEAGRESRNRNAADFQFALRHDVSLDWLFYGEGMCLAAHLVKPARGKVAILPVLSAIKRKAFLEAPISVL